jgi:hypothetical protein
MITYEGIEPFRGIKLTEDTQELGWDGIKRNFLKVNRKQGIYIYHKSSGSPSYLVIQVASDGKARELLTPKVDNHVFPIYTNTEEINLLMIQALMFTRELKEEGRTKQLYKEFKDEITDKSDSFYSYVLKNTDSHNIFLSTLRDKFKKDFSGIYHKYMVESELSINHDASRTLSLDVGIIGPSPGRSGTYFAVVSNPTARHLAFLGYEPNTSLIDATSKEGEDYDSYGNPTFRGRAIHDLRNDIDDAIESSKSAKIGWASNPSDL